VRTILNWRHPAIADLEHVGIVPVAGAGEWPQRFVPVEQLEHRMLPIVRLLLGPEIVGDVAGRAPEIADVLCPQPRLRSAPLAHRKDDVAAALAQRVGHQRISLLSIAVAGAAPIVFQVIDAPAGIGQRVLIFVALASWPAAAEESSAFPVDESGACGAG
jgi:hypothetical protein